jgi:hypothetical protein
MNIPIWSVQINEESCGHYIARCVGPLGHVLEYNGGEEFEDKIIEGMFGIESVYSGEFKSEIGIIVSFNGLVKYEYHQEFFGSWRIIGQNDLLEYDGKNGWIEHTKNGNKVKVMSWNNGVKISDLKYCVKNFNKI